MNISFKKKSYLCVHGKDAAVEQIVMVDRILAE